MPEKEEFKKEVRKTAEDFRTTKVNHRYLHRSHLLTLVDELAKLKDNFRFYKLNWKRALRNLIRSKRDFKKQIKHHAANQRFANLILNLYQAEKEGKLQETSTLFNFMSDAAQNLTRGKKGHRFSTSTKRLAASFKLQCGRKGAAILQNILDISPTTWNKFLKEEKIELKEGICNENFEQVADIYKKIILEYNEGISVESEKIQFPILFKLAQDETPITKGVSIQVVEEGGKKSLYLLGFCGKGKKKNNHCCSFGEFRIKVNNVDEICSAFDEYKLATHLLLYVLEPCGM